MQQGFTSMALLTSVTMLSMAAYYVSNLRAKTRNDVETAKVAEVSETSQNAVVSSLSLVRGLLNEGPIGGSAYQPAIYAQNYFDSNWKLTDNNSFSNLKASAANSDITLSTFGSTDVWFPHLAGDAFRGKLSAEKEKERYKSQTVKIQSVVRDDPNKPYWVKAVEVEIPPIKPGDNATRARIPLKAPIPRASRFG